MIFYFSGTGNSKHIAERMAELTNEQVKNVADYYDEVHSKNDINISVPDGEILGFVCPVHSWGLALTMRRFLKKARFKYNGNKVFGICVCGDTCGKAREQMQEALAKSGIKFNFVCSVQMPNTYIVMKGFGTDPDNLADQKLEIAEKELPQIADAIMNGKVFDRYVTGGNPFLKGRIIYPLFMSLTLGDKKFSADDKCISCGLCAKNCPEHNIQMKENRPEWLGHCVKCLACIHRCPKQAIQYGDITQDMGRYYYKKSKV